jgi:hypothetical protein
MSRYRCLRVDILCISQVDVEGISDEQILHSAVGILRRDTEKLKISVEDYPKSQSTSTLLTDI